MDVNLQGAVANKGAYMQAAHVAGSPGLAVAFQMTQIEEAGTKKKKKKNSDAMADGKNNVDTHKVSNETLKSAGAEASKRSPGHNPGGVLHQRRKLPYSPVQMAIAGALIVAGIAYFTLYAKKRPDASLSDVAKLSTRTSSDDRTQRSK
ncbi:hypothetical protein ACLOJK_032211 [Asimina triloba]